MSAELLPVDDARLLEQCEQTIERGLATFVDVGRALLDIRDGRLYRQSDGDFESYCQRRWSMGKPQAHRMIVAAEVVREVVPIGTVPATEAVARELAPLRDDLDKMREAWSEAVVRHGGQPTASQVREIVRPDALPGPDADAVRRAVAHDLGPRRLAHPQDPHQQAWDDAMRLANDAAKRIRALPDFPVVTDELFRVAALDVAKWLADAAKRITEQASQPEQPVMRRIK